MTSENPNSTQPYHKINTNPIPSAPPLPSSSNPKQPSPPPPSSPSSSSSSSPPRYPTVDHNDVVENASPDSPCSPNSPHNASESAEDAIISIPGAYLHLIDKHHSVELAMGYFSIMQLRQGNTVVAIFARVGNEIQWPLNRDGTCVKLDRTHYFFSIRAPKEHEKDDDMLNYGLTFALKGQEDALRDLDELLEVYSRFSFGRVEEKNGALDVSMVESMSPGDLKSDSKKRVMEQSCRAYWTTLAPNVEDYSGTAAKLIAVGSGHLVKGILWCGDVTVDRLKWGNEVLKMKIGPGTDRAVSPKTLKNIRRVNKVTKMTEKVAGGVLSGVLKITGYVGTSVANSKLGKKFFKYVPGEMALATLDGFSKYALTAMCVVCDAFEVSGRNVMSTSSTVTTDIVTYKYGEETAKATNEALDAGGHAIGAAWTVFKIRTAVVNPRGVLAPVVLGKGGIRGQTEEMKAKAIKDMKAKESPKKHKDSPKKHR
ncbi:putative senescence/spartin-associated [Helianthus anomalus]